jgi:hypothetical protein
VLLYWFSNAKGPTQGAEVVGECSVFLFDQKSLWIRSGLQKLRVHKPGRTAAPVESVGETLVRRTTEIKREFRSRPSHQLTWLDQMTMRCVEDLGERALEQCEGVLFLNVDLPLWSDRVRFEEVPFSQTLGTVSV